MEYVGRGPAARQSVERIETEANCVTDLGGSMSRPFTRSEISAQVGASDKHNRDLIIGRQCLEKLLVPAIVNLANIHYELDELPEAEALYEKAIRVDADCFEAYFNLGNIHHDLRRFLEALAAYRDALAINPHYPEAHFYLAVTLEKLGRSSEARPHRREYRQLAPDGEFVELARVLRLKDGS